jgi:hypothetical protein
VEKSKSLKISLNKLAIFGLIIITLISLAMKESNIASMAVGGIAGFIGQKALREVQEDEIGIDSGNQQQIGSQIEFKPSNESEIQQSEEIILNTEELSPEGVKEEDIA